MGQEGRTEHGQRQGQDIWLTVWVLEIGTVLGWGEALKSRDVGALHNCQDGLRHMD